MFENYVVYFKKENIDKIISVDIANSHYYKVLHANMSKHFTITKDNEPISIEFRLFFDEQGLLEIPERV